MQGLGGTCVAAAFTMGVCRLAGEAPAAFTSGCTPNSDQGQLHQCRRNTLAHDQRCTAGEQLGTAGTLLSAYALEYARQQHPCTPIVFQGTWLRCRICTHCNRAAFAEVPSC